jgi:hypothetical protein
MAQIKLTSLIQKIEQKLTDVRNQFLVNMAEDIVQSTISPKAAVDTGAYITSHSIRTTRGAGRSRTSHGKPRGQDPEAKAAEALSQLMEDIASLPQNQEQVYLTNNAPHANNVEYSHGYFIYEGVRNRAGIHLQDAINAVKARQ